MNLVFGLANRLHNYGIRNQVSNPLLLSLKDILDAGITYFDGAEKYGWHPLDLKVISQTPDITLSTKIDAAQYNENKLRILLLSMRKTLASRSRLWIYMHNRVTPKALYQYHKLIRSIGSSIDCLFGVSVYTQSDINILAQSSLVPDMVQLPINLASDLNISHFRRSSVRLIGRSIFLQGLYFSKTIPSTFPTGALVSLDRQEDFFRRASHELKLSKADIIFLAAKQIAQKKGITDLIISSSSIENIHRCIFLNNMKSDCFEIGLPLPKDTYNEFLADPRLW